MDPIGNTFAGPHSVMCTEFLQWVIKS